MTPFIHPADTDGSPAALDFCMGWARICREADEKQAKVFAQLRSESVDAAFQDDGWANGEPGYITVFLNDRQYQYIDRLYFGAKIALIGAGDKLRYLNLLEPAPTMFDNYLSQRIIGPESMRFKCMPFDPTKDFWTVTNNVSSIDKPEYFIRDKPAHD